mmetsp:Transcript_41368/g.72057  ORF Transcript_41368/g.72057 Transcript_41368/m.72057 type:complete len:86 (+) Transcript_41368:1370-1627(+)
MIKVITYGLEQFIIQQQHTETTINFTNMLGGIDFLATYLVPGTTRTVDVGVVLLVAGKISLVALEARENVRLLVALEFKGAFGKV